jgi:hypothetical protein
MNSDKPIAKFSSFAPCIACALTAMSLVVSLDSVLLQTGLSTSRLLLVSNLFIGALSGLLALQLQFEQRRRHKLLEDRIEVLSEVSQHVRGVLTAITFYGTQTGNPHSAQIVSKTLARIESNLGQLFTRLLFGDAMPQSTLNKVKAIAVSLLNSRPEAIEGCRRES